MQFPLYPITSVNSSMAKLPAENFNFPWILSFPYVIVQRLLLLAFQGHKEKTDLVEKLLDGSRGQIHLSVGGRDSTLLSLLDR